MIVINGKVYRNTQEQVQKNKEDIETKQDKLIAGTNITINGNTISATGGGGTPSDYDTVKAQVETNRLAIATEEESRKASYTKVESDISSVSTSLDDLKGTVEENVSNINKSLTNINSDLSDLQDKVSPIEDMCCRDNVTTGIDEINQYISKLKTQQDYFKIVICGYNLSFTLSTSTGSTSSLSTIVKAEIWYDKSATAYMGIFTKAQATGNAFECSTVGCIHVSNIEISTIGTQAHYYLGYNAEGWL